eukprot:6213824-Pleurochrysis_carterae.AAC.3
MSYKWGHPVATLPVTNGTSDTSHSQNDINSANQVIRRIYVKRRIVPSVTGESGDGMAPLICHCPSTY